jgi:hypothetical protein
MSIGLKPAARQIPRIDAHSIPACATILRSVVPASNRRATPRDGGEAPIEGTPFVMDGRTDLKIIETISS